jgi:diguanylate cyclase (GGDEF)-like protein/PAS domain S-box-containing protein
VTADKKGSTQAERLAVIEIVKEVLAGSAQLSDAAPQVLEVVCEHLGWDVGVISMVGAGKTLHRVGTWARDDGTDEVPSASTAALAGFLGSISFPIREDHTVLGTIELYSKDAKRPDDSLISTLEDVGAEIAEFVHRDDADEDDDDPDTTGGKYRTIVEEMPAVSYTAVADEGMRTLYVSPQIKDMLGISPTEWRNDPTLRSKHLFPSDRDRVLADYRRARQTGEPVHVEYRMQARDGSTVWVRESVVVPRDSAGKPTVMQGLIVDITSQRQGEQNDAYRAYHDELTGLPNRPMFEEFLEQVLLRAGGHNLAVAALTLNLDDFQLVNSSLGHDGGDELLRQVAVRLRDAAQEANLVARQEGDEFLLLLAGRERVGGSLRASADDALLVAEAEASRIQDALQSPFMIADNEFYVTASIGISIFPLDAEDGETMLEHAHTAMRKSKKTGPGGYVLFSKDADDPVRGLSFTTKLRKAVERKDWVLHYHPIVDLEGWDLVGVEALLRWRDSNGELVPPGEFILAAEDMGLIEAVGDWVVDEICRQSRTWREDGLELDISINLSPRQLWQPNLVERISSSLRASRVDPETIVIEVPETAAMADPDRTRRVLEQFREEGLKIAIDDFGKALSSIRRLKDLPVDILKVDQSFVRKLPDDEDASTMARAIIQLAHSLGMVPLAEGIDSEAQREFLVGENCPLGQGYLFAKPMAAEDVAHWESQEHYVEEDEDEEEDDDDRSAGGRGGRDRIGGRGDEDDRGGRGRDGRDGRDGRGSGGGRGGDDEKPWAVAHAGDGSELSARSTQAGIAVAERPWGIVPPADEDVTYVVEGRSDEWDDGRPGAGYDDRPYESGYDDDREDPSARRRRHGGPSLGH